MSVFQLTEDQAMIQGVARDLAQKKIKGYAEAVDKEARFPTESIQALAECGMLATVIPAEFGGAGLDCLTQTLVIEETAKVCGSTAAVLASAQTGIDSIVRFGSAQQKESLLPRLAGSKIATLAFCEGPANLDPLKIAVKAEVRNSGYVINGVKRHVPNAGCSDYYIVVAATEGELTAFVVESKTPGVVTGRRDPKMGLQAWYTGELIFENCTVGAEAVFGGIGKGTEVILAAQDSDRLYMAAVAAGLALGAMKEAIEYVNVRVQFGKRIAQFQNTQYVMAEHMARVSAAEALLWMAAARKDTGEDYSNLAAMAKLTCSDAANLALRKCVQAISGFGYTREYPVERMMRDGKMTEVFSGSSEMQKDFIAQSIGVY